MFFKSVNNRGKEDTSPMFIKPFSKVNVILISTLLLIVIGIQTGFANTLQGSGLSTVYHIYSEGEYVGVISDKEKIEELQEQELQQAASEYGNLSLSIGTDLSIIPELVFAAETEDEPVLEKLHELLSVEAEATGVVIDDKLAFYVKDQDDYDEVIRQLKLQNVTEQELNEFEDRMSSTTTIPPLKEGETRILDILFSGEMKAETGSTSPEEVRTVKEALVLLNKGTLEEKKYVIQSGDVLGGIASAHQMTTAKLLELNPGYTVNTLLQLGDELNVTVTEPYVEVEVHYEAKNKQTIKHKEITEKDSSMFKGEKKVTQKGSDGEKIVTKYIRKRNGQTVGSDVIDEKILVEPTDKVLVVGTKVMPSRGTGTFVWPTAGGYVSSQMGVRWGRVHQGIDIARPSSRTILAADNGVVTKVSRHSTYGNHIVIKHNNGYETLYAHLASTNVKVGQTVPQGAKIGVMGSTGRSTGVHLHFEVMKNGKNINPLTVVRK